MVDLKKLLKFRLPKWKDKKFVIWMFNRKNEGEDVHHLILKANSDLFLVNILADVHSRIHLKGYEDGEFESLFLQALKNIQDYVNYLEKE